MEYLLENLDEWLSEELDKFDDDEYLLIDCPGQIELYTHVPIMKRIVEKMSLWGHTSRIASVFVVDATFVCDAPKFISGSLLSLSAMIALELPHVNVLSKCDLINEEKVANMLDVESASMLFANEEYKASVEDSAVMKSLEKEEDKEKLALIRNERQRMIERRRKHNRLTEAICSLLDDYSMVSFIPLNIKDDESIDHVLAHVDHTIQYGEDLEVRGADDAD